MYFVARIFNFALFSIAIIIWPVILRVKGAYMDSEELLKAHEKHSAERAAHLESVIQKLKGISMSEGMTDKVDVHNIFKGMGGGDGGAPWAAILPALAQNRHDGFGGLGGIGGGVLGGALAGLLFRRGGLGGDSEGGTETRINDTVFNTAVLGKLGAIEAAIPYNEAQVQLALAATQTALTAQATTNANASAIAVGNVKDAVQSAALIAQQNAANILQAIANSTNTIVAKIDGNTIANLQAELAESRGSSRSREVEVNVSQNVNQQQAQIQSQAQIAGLLSAINRLCDNHQNLQQGMINLGTMVGNTQTAANTRVA